MFEEHAILAGGFLIEILLFPGKGYRLSCRKGKDLLVEYQSNGRKHSRRAGGREGAYAFKSVEQLRYEFEHDAEDARRQG